MRKVFFIIMMVALPLMMISSCNDLEEYNPSGATAETIWNTPEGFQTLVNTAYGPISNMYGKMDAILSSEPGTDLWFKLGINGWGQMFAYSLTSTYGPLKNYWTNAWVGINYCNAGIERIDKAGFTSEKIKNSKEGEFRYLRAFYYWHIVETFGNISLNTTESAAPSLSAKRSSIDELYKVIIEDLELAAKYLPVTQSQYGRATRKGAYGFLARALLTRAYYSLDKNDKTEADSYFSRAKEVAHLVIDSAANWGVSLYPEYADLWKNSSVDGTNKNCKEALCVVYIPENLSLTYDGKGNVIHQYFIWDYNGKVGLVVDLENGKRGSGIFMPTKFLLDLYDETKDSRYRGSFKDTWLQNNPSGYTWTSADCNTWSKDASLVGTQINTGDTAIYISKHAVPNKKTLRYLVKDIDDLYVEDTTVLYTNTMCPLLKKFMDPNRANTTTENGTLDIILMRLAEMYLIAAEAELQLGDKASAANDINVIRKRASKTHTNDMDITASDVTLDFILDERAREFAGEHLRWFDLKRTRLLVSRIMAHNKQVYSRIPSVLLQKGNGVFENCLLRPIPQDEMNALINRDEFGQNPGY